MPGVTGAAVTVGVDVASRPGGTAACWVRWDGGEATITRVEHLVDDGGLAGVLAEPVARIGLDVPLGWPDEFVAAVAEHHEGRPFGTAGMDRLTRRETDRWVHDHPEIRQLPLSVSTDRIAYPAMRMARILGEVVGEPIDRSGAGKFVEVYPAAALRVWGLRYRGYKRGADRQVLLDVAAALRRRCPWLAAPETHVGRGDSQRSRLRRPGLRPGRPRTPSRPLPPDPAPSAQGRRARGVDRCADGGQPGLPARRRGRARAAADVGRRGDGEQAERAALRLRRGSRAVRPSPARLRREARRRRARLRRSRGRSVCARSRSARGRARPRWPSRHAACGSSRWSRARRWRRWRGATAPPSRG